MINQITLIMGGCRSGKSSHALFLANQIPKNQLQISENQISKNQLHISGNQISENKPHISNSQNQISKNASQIYYKENTIFSSRKIFIATSVPTDNEMQDRVAKHQNERKGDGWKTVEVPVNLPAQIAEFSTNNTMKIEADVIVIDCLTLWISNLMIKNFNDDEILKMTESLQSALQNSIAPIFIVSNEVGAGIVPENNLARRFRDMAGMVNQKIAKIANQVIYMVAGIPNIIKNSYDNKHYSKLL